MVGCCGRAAPSRQRRETGLQRRCFARAGGARLAVVFQDGVHVIGAVVSNRGDCRGDSTVADVHRTHGSRLFALAECLGVSPGGRRFRVQGPEAGR